MHRCKRLIWLGLKSLLLSTPPMNRKANLFRLYPTPEQNAQMAQIAGACRFIHNLALEQRRDWYRPGLRFSFAGQCRELTALRAAVDWLKACPVHTLQQALKDLDRAYHNGWAGRAEAPTPRKKGINDEACGGAPL